jgi:DNA-binding protein YbaB
MMPGNGGADFDRLLRDTRSSLESLRGGDGRPARPDHSGPGRAADAPPVRGTGEACDGQVRAVATDGLLERLELEPRLMRMAPEQLAPHLMAAANAALDDLRAKAPAPDEVPAVDPGVLAERFGEVAGEGLARMASINQGLTDAIARISRQAYVSGDPGDHGLEHLLMRAQRTAQAAAGPAAPVEGAPVDGAPDEAAPVRGVGADANGLVSVEAGAGDRVEAVALDPRVMRAGSAELGERVVTAINAALEDLRAKAREHAAAGRPDLTEQLRAVQDLSLEHMRAYSQALSTLMSSIERR